MTTLLLATVYLGFASVALVASAVFERKARLQPRPDRPELAPLRGVWGGGFEAPPVQALTVRALAGFARIVRRQNVVSDHRPGLRLLGRIGACTSLAVGLAMLPFAGTWGGGPGDAPLVLLDVPFGLVLIGFLLMLNSFSRVAVGLSERNVWSRIGSVRQASRSIASLALLTLALAPLAIGPGSLRIQDIVLGQMQPIVAVTWMWETFGGRFLETLRAWPIPAWNLLTQPLTAILYVPAMALMLASPRIDDPASGATFAAGLGLDADPIDVYWSRLDARLSLVLVCALFVTLFLGAGSVPFFDPTWLVSRLVPFVGQSLPSLLVAAIYLGSFLAKCLLVLAAANRLKRVMAVARVDRALRFATRRLLPLAWANFLLVAAMTLWWADLWSGVSR